MLQLPDVVYHNMIKAFGRCGDLETAFSILDEMKDNRVPISAETFNHLFQGCISDKNSGFRHIIIAWRSMMNERRIVRQNLNYFTSDLQLILTKLLGT